MATKADVPQADRLEQVGKVVMVSQREIKPTPKAKTSSASIRPAAKGACLAAEVLGLISNQPNHAVLTLLGKESADLTSNTPRMDCFARCLVDTPVVWEALRYIDLHKPSVGQLRQWVRSFYPGARSTAVRRFHGFISCICDAKWLKRSANLNQSQRYFGSVVKQTTPPSQGLTGRKCKPSPTIAPTTSSTGVIRVDVDAQKRDRVSLIHWQLIEGTSSCLADRDLEPYENEHVQVFTNGDGDVIRYEMKSVDLEGSHLLSQARNAVSQLYEYRYIYEERKARRCIVTNHGIAKKSDWLLGV